jgi:hypothetical protein
LWCGRASGMTIPRKILRALSGCRTTCLTFDGSA